MKTPVLASTLQSVQQLIERETGAPLPQTTRTQLAKVLNDAVRNSVGMAGSENFSSREVTVLLTDLRGFTAISEAHSAPVLLEMLNRYLVKMSEIAIANGGTIDKFMGDAIMVLFGAPFAHADDVLRAVTCAVEMQLALFDINTYHRLNSLPEWSMGIGINTGTMMAGLLGSEIYAEYTVIGDEVNLASRIGAYSLRGQILISEATYRIVRDHVIVGEPMDVYVKGKKEAVNLYEVLSMPSLGKQVPRQEVRKSPRVETHIPFEFQVLIDKSVAPKKHGGTILDLSYNGVLAALDIEVPAHTDIKLDLSLSIAGTSATDVRARVLRTIERDGQRLASIEFTAVSVQCNIKYFVQLLIQGSGTK